MTAPSPRRRFRFRLRTLFEAVMITAVHNLTVRTFIRRFTRLAPGLSKKIENLEAACAAHFAYFNF